MITAPFRGPGEAKTFGRHVQNATIRALTSRLSPAQIHIVRGTSTGTFNKWAASHPELVSETEILADGAKIHWIGAKKGAKVLYHIHGASAHSTWNTCLDVVGGGYIVPLSFGHIDLGNNIKKAVLENTDQALSIALLEYSAYRGLLLPLLTHPPATSPPGTYPIQFRQANIGLKHLLDSGISPSDIILGGDSAGGHIGLCLISHLLKAHPALDAPPQLSTPLAGLLLISPRVTNKTDAPSFEFKRDALTGETFRRWIASFRANSPISTEEGLSADGVYTEPLLASHDWWTNLPSQVVNRMFISAGNNECIRDNIVAFREKMEKVEGLDVSFVLEENGIHDSPLMDVYREPTDLVLSIYSWLGYIVNES